MHLKSVQGGGMPKDEKKAASSNKLSPLIHYKDELELETVLRRVVEGMRMLGKKQITSFEFSDAIRRDKNIDSGVGIAMSLYLNDTRCARLGIKKRGGIASKAFDIL